MIEWWNALETAAQIFYLIAIPSTLVLVVQTVLMFIGMGEDADGVGDVPDADVADTGDISYDVSDGDADGVFGEETPIDINDAWGLEGLRIFTIRGIIAFLVVFGWVGVAMIGAGVSLWITLPVATFCGFLMMVLLAYIFRAVMRLRSDGNTNNRNAVGKSGKVYLTIPPSRSGEGKVNVMLQGSYVERDAVTDEEESIPTGAEVVVIGISGDSQLVVRRK